MSPDDPIYDPVRQIAAATVGINQTLASFAKNLDRLTTLTEQHRDLSVEVLKTQRTVTRVLWCVSISTIVMFCVALAVFWQCGQLQEQHTLMQAETRATLHELLRRHP